MVKRRISSTEQMVATIYGLTRVGNVVRVFAYKKGSSVKLWGPNGSHLVHAMNERTNDGWCREAALVWGLSDVFDLPSHLRGGESEKLELARLEEKGRAIRAAKNDAKDDDRS